MTVEDLMEESTILIHHGAIADQLDEIADQITVDWAGLEPIILCVMNGGIMFTSELMKRLEFPVLFDYCQVSSYGDAEHRGELQWKREPEIDMKDRVVIICDDIYDTGHTMHAIKKYCEYRGAIVRVAVLLNKTERNRVEIPDGYVCFHIEDKWVFGFGMDCADGFCRNLADVWYKI